MKIIRTSQPLSDRERNAYLFKGDLIIFCKIPAMLELQREMDGLIRGQFGDRASLSDLSQSDPQGFAAEMALLQTSFYNTARMRDLFKAALEQSGMSIQHSYADKLFLRCVPPTRDSNSQFRGSIGHHRDTWGSNIQHQINWWSPIYPISDGNTLTFYPHHWSAPVVNTTADWSFEAFRKARQQAQAISATAQIDYPYAPQAIEAVSDEGVNILLDPGDLLCFSSAHLHGSSAEPRTGFRFNLEMRSFGEKDIDRDSPPENVDNAQSQPNYHWFNRISDGAKYSQ